MFRVGQKVVCVKKGRWMSNVRGYHDDGPVFGERCVVTSISGNFISIAGYPKKTHTMYKASRFRPVVTRKTDISVFRALLNPVKEEA